jgi:hypothetical protein
MVSRMFAGRRLGLDPGLETRTARAGWIAWARLAAVPLVLFEVAVERGNYPDGDERVAWALAGGFAFAAALLLLARGRGWAAPAGLAVDAAFVSAFVALYSFEAGTTARQVLVLPVVEGALLYALRGGLLLPLASLPALAFFEWRQAERLDLHPFDPGHVVGPVGIQLLVGVVVGALVARLERLKAS